MTTNVSTVDDTMPPIIGTAMRCMTSEPVPLLHMIGNSPGMIATTVIISLEICLIRATARPCPNEFRRRP